MCRIVCLAYMTEPKQCLFHPCNSKTELVNLKSVAIEKIKICSKSRGDQDHEVINELQKDAEDGGPCVWCHKGCYCSYTLVSCMRLHVWSSGLMPRDGYIVHVRPGMMHTLMSFLGCIGNLMKVSGGEVRVLMKSTFGCLTSILNGKSWPQGLRAFRILTAAFLDEFLDKDSKSYAEI